LSYKEHIVQDWEYTFPLLDPTNEYQPIQLNENLYYLNSIESVTSAMEGSTIAGRNIAQLISIKETRK